MIVNIKVKIYKVLLVFFHLIFKIMPTNFLRIFFLKIIGAKIGKNNYISRNVKFDFPWRLIIGNNNYISKSVYLDCRGGHIIIGNSCDISSSASIYTLSHDIYSSNFSVKKSDIRIGSRVWICVNAILLPGSYISDGTVVAASSVVSNRLKSFSLYQGNPVKNIKKLPISRASKVRKS
jgi:putative colanic acid biosynthesis acetyltransferase WcaF